MIKKKPFIHLGSPMDYIGLPFILFIFIKMEKKTEIKPEYKTNKTKDGFYLVENCIDEIEIWKDDKMICYISLPERTAEFIYVCHKCGK